MTFKVQIKVIQVRFLKGCIYNGDQDVWKLLRTARKLRATHGKNTRLYYKAEIAVDEFCE